MRSFVVLITTGLVFVLACSASANLLLNPGFEDWSGTVTADYWEKYVCAGSTSSAVIPCKGTTFAGTIPISPHGGTEFQRLKLNNTVTSERTRGGIYQQVAVTPGVTYRVSAYLAARITSSTGAEARLGVEDGQQTVPVSPIWSDVVSGDTPWILKTLEIIPTSNWITVFLEGYHPVLDKKQCNVFFDDACVEAIPEPASLAAVLSGLVALGGCALRRRR